MKKSLLKTLLLLVVSLLSVAGVYAQTTIKGTVTDEAGEPVIGAYITLQSDKSVGTITDFDGNYEISVPANSNLIFSYTGYEDQVVSTAGQTTIDVTLKESSSLLEEVVAIGYGSQTKKELTGSVVSVKSDDFDKGSFNSAAGLLQGKVAGLTMSKQGGNDPANRDYNIQIRGTGSLTGSTTPLYIIDGVPGASMNSLNPNDIESMDVLKDGSAAAIYGTRANAGVVIITTKKGKEGRTNVEYNGSMNVQTIAGKANVMNKSQFLEAGGADYGSETEWEKEITRIPVSTEHNIALSGGMEKVNYRASVSYKLNNGIARNSSFQEIVARANVNQFALNKIFEFNYDVSYSTSRSSWVNHDAFQQSMKYNPTMPIHSDPSDPLYKEYGGYYQNFDKNGFSNPVAIIDQETRDGKDQTFLGSFRLTVHPVKGLKLGAFGSYQLYNQTTGSYYPKTSTSGYATAGKGEKYNQDNVTRVGELTAQYGNEIKKNAFTFLVGYGYQDYVAENHSASNGNFISDDFLYNNLGAGQGRAILATGGSNDGLGVGSWKDEWLLASFFGRFIYNYDQRYFINASVRAEGSSKFGRNNRWGWFPSVSGSWLITNEQFMKNQTVVDELKLRVGWGVTGNMPGDNYPWMGRMAVQEDYGYFGHELIPTYALSMAPNPDLRWERKSEVNAGIDFSFLGGRLSGTIDYYNRTTRDLIYNFAVDVNKYGASHMLANCGAIRNQGVEIAINGVPVKMKNFVWNLGLTLAYNQNRVLQLGDDVFVFPEQDKKRVDLGDISGWTGQKAQLLEVGQPVGNYYGFKFSRIDENGKFYGYDKNGNEKLMTKLKEDDKVILGNALPLLTWGLSSSMSFYGVDLSFNIRGAIGGLMLNKKRLAFSSKKAIANGNMIIHKDNEYTTPTCMTDYYLEDGSYGKLGDLTIGYTFTIKPEVAKYLSKARIYLTGQNLVTVTGYSGIDPEYVNMSGLEPGVEGLSYYPTTRTFMFGVNLGF